MTFVELLLLQDNLQLITFSIVRRNGLIASRCTFVVM